MQLRIDKATLLAVMECMAVRDVRYYICGICFLPDGKVAGTDGNMLAYGEHDNQIDHEVILSVGKLPTKIFDYAQSVKSRKLLRRLSVKSWPQLKQSGARQKKPNAHDWQRLSARSRKN